MVRSFYGQTDLFIILSTLDEWRICWLPDCDKCAFSSSMQPITTEPSDENEGTIIGERLIHGSKIFHYTDTELIPVLISVFLKGYYGSHGSVSVMSYSRPFIHINSESWSWLRLPSSFDITMPLRLGVPTDVTSLFIVRYFSAGGDGRTILAIDCKERILCAVKLFFPIDSEISPCSLERKLWKDIWNVDTIKCKLIGQNALVMPLVFCARVKKNDMPTKIFSLKLSEWLYNYIDIGDTETDRPAMEEIVNEVQYCYNKHQWTVDEAKKSATLAMRDAGYEHADMKTEHVALLPRLDEAGHISSLQPILIDLSRVNILPRS